MAVHRRPNLYDLQGTDLHSERYAQFFDSFGFKV